MIQAVGIWRWSAHPTSTAPPQHDATNSAAAASATNIGRLALARPVSPRQSIDASSMWWTRIVLRSREMGAKTAPSIDRWSARPVLTGSQQGLCRRGAVSRPAFEVKERAMYSRALLIATTIALTSPTSAAAQHAHGGHAPAPPSGERPPEAPPARYEPPRPDRT